MFACGNPTSLTVPNISGTAQQSRTCEAIVVGGGISGDGPHGPGRQPRDRRIETQESVALHNLCFKVRC